MLGGQSVTFCTICTTPPISALAHFLILKLNRGAKDLIDIHAAFPQMGGRHAGAPAPASRAKQALPSLRLS